MSPPVPYPLSPEPPCYDAPEILDTTKAIINVVENSPHPKCRREQILWLMNDLIRTGGRRPDGAPVSSKYVHHRIGKKAQADAKRLKLITQVKPHQAGVGCARYRLRHPSATPATYTLTSKRLIEKRGSIEHDCKCRLKAAKLSPALFDNLRLFETTPAFRTKADEILKQMEADGKDTASTVASFEFIESGNHRLSVKLGRLTNEIVGLPPELRLRLHYNGRPVAEVDIKSSHPTWLALIFAPETTEQEAEFGRFMEMIRLGQFYETFEACWEEDKHLFKDYCHAGEKDRDRIEMQVAEFLALSPRKGIKLCWQVILNGKGDPSRLFTSQTWAKFDELFPIMAKRIAGMKRTNPRKLGGHLRAIEAQFVSAIAQAFEHPTATTYDGWLVEHQHAQALSDAVRAFSGQLLGFCVHTTIEDSTREWPRECLTVDEFYQTDVISEDMDGFKGFRTTLKSAQYKGNHSTEPSP
ncbi:MULTISPECIES: hypothetical protein [unclassified Lentimonas]|uniref:hypothetical protein n=1 Tax=unclassified Lentimonas TaxID=2630993 RepID=UPI00138A272B|nr:MULTISPECIES: hypothetical protein [unclassified Lentimonas]